MQTKLVVATLALVLIFVSARTAGVSKAENPARENVGNSALNCLTPNETSHDGNTVIYRIYQPEVRKAYQCYDIPMQPGDRVKVSDVHGCVDTGGHGRTWKRFRNPLGSSADRLYHGRIWVPGATDGLVRIASVYQQELTVNELPPYYDGYPLRIWLGYEDENYSDNGYSEGRRDSGTQHQCKDASDAQVEIRITSGPMDRVKGNVQAYPKPTAPFDLDWAALDANLLPLNPFWHVQRGQWPKQLPDVGDACNYFHNEQDIPKVDPDKCTIWNVDIDEGWLGSANCKLDIPRVGSLVRKLFTHGLVAGHINWGVVTYEGKIYFWDYEKFPLDRDYDLYLIPDDHNAGLTVNNSSYEPRKGLKIPALGLEFYAHETIRKFNERGTWWDDFATAVKKGNPFIGNPLSVRQSKYEQATRLVDGRRAIVIGLFGIDNEHHSHTEIHPVLGLAIRVDDDGDQSTEQRWAIFATNWGTEGDCSNRVNFTGHYEHQLGRDQMSFFFRAPTSAAVRVDEAKTKFYLGGVPRNDSGATNLPSIKNLPDGVVLTLYPGAPSQNGKPKIDPIIYGELWLTRKS